jgi:hypothetical protein
MILTNRISRKFVYEIQVFLKMNAMIYVLQFILIDLILFRHKYI